MELLKGTNLDALDQRVGPLPEALAVYLLKQACGSLAEAHAAVGLPLRDVELPGQNAVIVSHVRGATRSWNSPRPNGRTSATP